MESLAKLIRSYQYGTTLPRAFYVAHDVFLEDMQQVFGKNWLFVGHTCELANHGDYLTVAVGDEPIVIVRDREGQLHGHFNVCRHRGSKLVDGACGNTKALVCPYHQWAYRLNGQLAGARLMGENFDQSAYQLHPVHVREIAGLVFICLAADPPAFAPAYDAIAPQLRSNRLDRAKVICRHHYTVQANWKTVLENNRECYHCQVSHPEFMLANYDLGLPGDHRHQDQFDHERAAAQRHWETLGLCPRDVSFPNGSWFRVARFPLKQGFLTESLDGQLTAPLMGDLTDSNVGSLRLVGLPNFWAHANADYVMTTRVLPLNAQQTRIDVTFLIHADAVEGVEYTADSIAAVWKATSEEDWALCERNYAGIRSEHYAPGPLSPITEASVQSFLDWYFNALQSDVSAWRTAA